MILEYLDHRAGGGTIIPREAEARFAALRLQALCDGILDASILLVYEGRSGRPRGTSRNGSTCQAGKVDARAWRRWKPRRRRSTAVPDVGQITLACALGYRDLRFGGTLARGSSAARRLARRASPPQVPAFAATKPPPASSGQA